jgi:hypothetical protein
MMNSHRLDRNSLMLSRQLNFRRITRACALVVTIHVRGKLREYTHAWSRAFGGGMARRQTGGWIVWCGSWRRFLQRIDVSSGNRCLKIALAALVEQLKQQRFVLLDTQWLTPHLLQFGAVEVSRTEYLELLERAVNLKRSFL